MADDDDDFEDLWADLGDDNDVTTLSVSENLLAEVGRTETAPVHKGDVDEGKITWEAPAFAGLGNSDSVTIKMHHWYRDTPTAAGTATTGVLPAAPAPVIPSAEQLAGGSVASALQPALPVVPAPGNSSA